MERVRQRRRPRDGVHAELQRDRRRLPRRSERPAARRHVRRRHRRRQLAQQRVLRAARARARGTTTRSSSTRTAPGATQITPYVDGQPVTYTKARQRHRRRQLRQLDAVPDVARRRGPVRRRRPRRARGLQPRAAARQTIADHYAAHGTNRRPTAAFTMLAEPGQARPDGDLQRLRRRRDPDGTIVNYQWDLDGNGSYETDTGTTPTVTKTYATAQTDRRSSCASSTTRTARTRRRRRSSVGNAPPTASFTATPSTADAQPDRRLRRLGFERTPTARSPSTSGTSTATARTRPTPARRRRPRKAYATAGNVHGRPAGDRRRRQDRHDDAHGDREVGHRTPASCSAPPGCSTTGASARRPGTTFADSKGTSPATRTGGDARRRRRAGRRHRTPRCALRRHRATSPSANAEPAGDHDADGRVLAQVERLRRRRRPGDGVHAELQRRTAAASWSTRTPAGNFGVGIGVGRARATTRSSRGRAPACGTTTRSCSTRRAPAATQITPYVDGQPVPYTKQSRPAPAPARSPTRPLYFMSAGGPALFGAGDLDEVAVYNRRADRARRSPHTTRRALP